MTMAHKLQIADVDAMGRALEFPLECLPGPVRNLVTAASSRIGCSPDFVATASIPVLAAAIGASTELQLAEGWCVRPSFFVCLLGPSGSGKSPAIETTVSALREVLATQPHSGQIPFDNRKDNAITGSLASPDYTCRIVSEATTEALLLALKESPGGVFYHWDELSGWLQSFNAYRDGKGSDRTLYMSLWDGRTYNANRVNRSLGPRRTEVISVVKPTLSIIGGMVPDRLPLFGNHRDIRDGLIQRFLFCVSNNAPPRTGTDPLTKNPDAEFRELLCALLERSRHFSRQHPRIHQLSDDARQYFDLRRCEGTDGWEFALRDEVNSYRPKLVTYLGRLALVLQVCDDICTGLINNCKVELETLLKADEIIFYFESQYARVVRLLHSNATLGRLNALLDAALRRGGEITLRDVYTSRLAGVNSREEALQLFIEAQWRGLGRFYHRPNPKGRPSIVFAVNTTGS